MRFIEHILSTIAPHQCLSCGTEGAVLCDDCGFGLRAVPERCYRCLKSSPEFMTCIDCRRHSALYSVRPATVYDMQAKALIHKLKFERARAAADDIARFLAERAVLPDGIVTHVPTATSRARMRGYDQAALIAKALARHTGAVYSPLLARMGQERQVGKNRRERQEQMKNLFFVTKKHPPMHVILIDDVITTGATLEACARNLKEAGVKRVSAIVFAAA